MKCPHTVNNDHTESLFKSGYEPEWSYTNVLIRSPHSSTDVTRSTGFGYGSSYIRLLKMGQYPIVYIVNTQVFSHWRIMSQAHNCFPVFFLYHYPADHFTFILHSRIWRSPFSLQYLVFHEIANINILCFLYWEWLRTR
jgi:hypothetical protein